MFKLIHMEYMCIYVPISKRNEFIDNYLLRMSTHLDCENDKIDFFLFLFSCQYDFPVVVFKQVA